MVNAQTEQTGSGSPLPLAVDFARDEKWDAPDRVRLRVTEYRWSLNAIAHDAEIEPYACTVEQAAALRAFGQWWAEKFPATRLTPSHFTAQWADFREAFREDKS